MLTGMSDYENRHSPKDRLAADRDRDAEEIRDWLNGTGSTVIGVAVVLLALWFLASLVIG